MKVKEFIEFATNSKNKLLKAEQMLEAIKKEINTKDYLGIKQKKELIESIIDECVLFEDGIYKFDDMDKYIYFTMRTIAAYTDLELSNDIEDDYDALCQANLIDLVIDTFRKEFNDVNIFLAMKCDYILNGNNVEALVGKFLNELLDKVDVFSQALSGKIKNFDIKQLNISGDDVQKLLSFIGKFVK